MAKKSDGLPDGFRGTIWKRNNNAFVARFRIKPGDEDSRVTKTFKTRREAVDFLTELNIKYDYQATPAPSQVTLQHWLKMWLDDKQNDVSRSTYNNYRVHIDNHLAAELGHLKLSEIKPTHVDRFINRKKKKLSGSYVHEMYTVLNQALDKAVRMQEIEYNPADSIKAPSQKSKKEMKILNPEQLGAILKTVDEEDPWFAPLYHLVINTGLRKGELLGLRWSDVDFNNQKISIRQQLLYEAGQGLYLKNLKTEESKRTVSLPKPVIEQLEKHKKTQDSYKETYGIEAWFGHERLAAENPEEHDLVFTEIDGKPIRPDRLYKHFRDILDKADCPRVTFHSIRHSHASILIQEEADIKTISRRLGHESIEITLKHYAHLLPGMDESAADKFGAAIYNQ